MTSLRNAIKALDRISGGKIKSAAYNPFVNDKNSLETTLSQKYAKKLNKVLNSSYSFIQKEILPKLIKGVKLSNIKYSVNNREVFAKTDTDKSIKVRLGSFDIYFSAKVKPTNFDTTAFKKAGDGYYGGGEFFLKPNLEKQYGKAVFDFVIKQLAGEGLTPLKKEQDKNIKLSISLDVNPKGEADLSVAMYLDATVRSGLLVVKK